MMVDVPGDTMTTMTTTAAISAVVTVVINVVTRAFTGGQSSGEVKQRLTSIETAIVAMQTDLRQLTDILVNQADMQARVNRAEKDIDDLRHGRGFIAQRSDGGVNGQWP